MSRQEDREQELAAQREIGRRVKQVRLARKLTLDQLAERAETSNQFLSQVEKGEQGMTMVKFGRLARALGVSADYLLFGRDPSPAAGLAAEYLGAMKPVERDILAQTVLQFQRLLDAIAPEHG